MQTESLTSADVRLFEEAKAQLEASFHQDRHVVAAALRTVNGAVHRGLHLGSRRVNVCAESSAMANAAMTGDEFVETIVAVCRDVRGRVIVTNPCGLCRELLGQYGPNAHVIVDLAGEVRKVPASALLPNPWMFPHETAWTVEEPSQQAQE